MTKYKDNKTKTALTLEYVRKYGAAIRKLYESAVERGAWYRGYESKIWVLSDKNPQFVKDTHYVENDEYAKYRMAIADGEIVEESNVNPILHPDTCEWDNFIEIGIDFRRPIDYYRIKPKL